MAMPRAVYMLKIQTAYLIRRSKNWGVTPRYITGYRKNILEFLGDGSFRYLEQHLDGSDGYWRVDGAFSWERLYSKRSVFEVKEMQLLRDETLYSKYEGVILGAIDKALGGKWWFNLSPEAQEAIHDGLHQVLDIKS